MARKNSSSTNGGTAVMERTEQAQDVVAESDGLIAEPPMEHGEPETASFVQRQDTAPNDDFRDLVLSDPTHVFSFNPDELIADPTRNGRFKERKITDPSVKALAGMIAAEGQLQEGEVTLGLDGMLYVTFGTGRYLAIKSINSTRQDADKLPFYAKVKVETADDPIGGVIRNAMENWGRLDLTVLDKAEIVGRLLAQGIKQAEICRRLGNLPKSNVGVYAKMYAFPDQVKQWIAEEKISAKAAYDLAVVDPGSIEAEAKKLIDASDGKKVTSTKAANATGKKRKGAAEESEADGEDDAPGKPAKKQRTAKQIMDFIEAEAVPATAKKYGDKNLVAKLQLIGKFVGGMTEGTFLKNLAGL